MSKECAITGLILKFEIMTNVSKSHPYKYSQN